ncbi:hypothetical protein A5649_17055 [Mycolicibacter heraklionensis]|uniref:DUF6542 domain-containing protein n=1 Tax=Mycolicibacter heraklionensis TaxID=512402 RepID=A0AA91IZ01_9MYCO|nr:DUF6542 domain-containing protein [Mycolicibacter heraklionensis]OBK87772.1 hypothetical protein A5649_17055 [Mycolicibacter heraklionensis]
MAVAREKSAVAADHRSILPSIAGLPWWSAVAVAVVATAIGVAFDAGSGDKELTIVFSALYAMGCIAAVLMVQQSAVFTTVVQPPLILFVSVPGAYWMLRGGGFPGLKAIVINCGYPLIERFPLMLFTAAAVLLIGMVRWYLGMLGGTTKREAREDDATPKSATLSDRIGAMLTAALTRNPAHAIEKPASREDRPGQRPRRATAEARRAARQGSGSRSRTRSTERRAAANGSAPTRSRHVRPDMDPRAADHPRPRRRPAAEGRDEPMQRRRRPAPEAHDERQPRRRPAPDWQDEPRRRPRPTQDGSRSADPLSRTNRDPHSRSYRPSDAPESMPRRRPAPSGSEGRGNGTGTRHPVSQVRYRGSGTNAADASPRARSRPPRDEVDSWEYDV